MFYCEKCKVFYENEEVPEWQESETGYIHQECPICGEDLLEARFCVCGEPIPPDNQFCEICKEKVQEALENLKSELQFDKAEFFDIIDEVLEDDAWNG